MKCKRRKAVMYRLMMCCSCALLTSFIWSVVMGLLLWSIAPSATMMILSRFLSARFYKGKKARTHTSVHTYTPVRRGSRYSRPSLH